MSWAKLDDGFYDHPKIIGLDLAAVGLFAVSLSYAAKQLTNGKLSRELARHLSRGNEALVAQLVAARLWDADEHGYVIHDFLDFNPPAKCVQRKRKAARVRMQRLRVRSREPIENRSRSVRDTGCLEDGTGRDGKNKKESSSLKARPWRVRPAGELLTPERRTAAEQIGLEGDAVDREWAKYGDHRFERAKVDVDGTWRNWCRRELEIGPRRSGPSPGYRSPAAQRQAETLAGTLAFATRKATP